MALTTTIILTTKSVIPEVAGDRKAQHEQRTKMNAIVDKFEADIAALGGVTETDVSTKRVREAA